MRSNRKLSNMVIDPRTQSKILGQFVFMIFIFFGLAGFWAYDRWNDVILFLVEMSDVPDSTKQLVLSELSGFVANMFFLLLVLFLFVTGLIVVHTHRFLGARYAICKYIEENLTRGKYDNPLILRKNDYLKPIAKSLGTLAETLHEKETGKSAKESSQDG